MFARELEAGGKPSTWFPPGPLVELSFSEIIQSLRAFRRAAPSALNSDVDCFCTSCMGHLHPYTSWMITLHLIEVLENPVSVPAV